MTNSQSYFTFLLNPNTINSSNILQKKENTMNNTPNNNDPYAFKELLNTDNLHLFYAQMLNAVRLDKHNAVYVFDEVGCGKTVSAIMAIAKTIWDKENNIKSDENNDTHFRILVITPKSVCPQFKGEILDKLKFDEDIHYLNDTQKSFRLNSADVEDISNLSGDSLISEIESKNHIVIANPHKMCKLSEIKWDLIVIDEAHDIVCNSKKQTEEFHKHDEIMEVYEKLMGYIRRIPDESIQEKFNVLSDEVKDRDHKDFVILVHAIYYNELIRHFKEYDMENIPIPENRTDIKLYRSLLDLISQRVMFLSATPYKNAKEPDFLNYAYAATKIVSDDIVHLHKLPNLSWVEHLYKENFEEDDLQQFENSNTSMLFKEVANSIPFKLKTDHSIPKETKSKHRFIRTCKPNNLARLPLYLFSLNFLAKITKELFASFNDEYTTDDKNRAIIFVSCSAEGEEVFKKIFPGDQTSIFQSTLEGKQYTYKDPITGLTCEFVMNKFGNAKYLNHYSKEPKEQDGYTIPDILIVTWQVAQVGVNLPTFNHVIHYNISQLPGSIEQRFGRIDRMTTSMRNLHNIYCFDEGSTNHYNLSKALENYMNTLVNSNCNLPVKNLLLNQGLELPKYNEDKTMEYIKLYINNLNALDFNPGDENFKGEVADKIKSRIKSINQELKTKGLSPIGHTSSDQDNLQGMYCDELPEMPDNDSKPTDEQKTRECTIEAVKRFLTMIEDLLNTLNDKIGFNDRIDKINSTNFDAGDIIYAGSSNNNENENSETSSESTVKGKINLEEVVENINRVRANRTNL